MEAASVRRKRGLSPEEARSIRQRGHYTAKEFALAIGMGEDYRRDPLAKKDVIDLAGDAHSVKGGEKKWQIFLYSKGRFETDASWQAMDGVGQAILRCIGCFPPSFDEYQSDKESSKQRLRREMAALAELLQDRRRLRAFLEKAIFNGNEVAYLTFAKGNGDG